MKLFLSTTAIAILGLAIFAPQALAQSRKPLRVNPPKLQIPQEEPKEEMIILTPLITGSVVESEMLMMEISPPPGVEWTWCEAVEARITRKAYQFICKMTYGGGDTKTSLWVIRRDGTAPSWALSPDDFKDVRGILSDKRYGFESAIGQPRGKKVYIRTFYTLKNKKAPNSYCSANTRDYRSAEDGSDSRWTPDGHNSLDCYDLMTISYKPQQEN